MQCPNCKTDLVNINGRYICSDCGKEVPEAEINMGDWGQGSLGGGKIISNAEGVDEATSSNIGINDDFLVGEQGLPTNSPSEQVVTSDPIKNETKEVPDDGFYTSVDPITVAVPEIKAEDIGSLAPAVEIEAANQEVSQEVLGTDDLVSVPAMETVEATNFIPEAPLQPLLPDDPDIYRDPITEDMSQESQPAYQESAQPKNTSVKRRLSLDKKAMITTVSVGIGLAILLLAGGLYAYFSFTQKSQQNLAGATIDVVDCDSSEDKEGCVAENFSSCSSAKWTGEYTDSTGKKSSLAYLVTGLVEDKCSIDLAQITQDETTAQSMSCIFTPSSDVNELQKLSADNCSGDLTETLFGKATTAESTTTASVDQSENTVSEETNNIEDTGNLESSE